MMLLDISGARKALDMENAASEIFGFTHSLFYDDKKAVSLRSNYNDSYSDTSDIFSPIMMALRDSSQQMGTMVDFVDAFLMIIGGVFLVIVTIILQATSKPTIYAKAYHRRANSKFPTEKLKIIGSISGKDRFIYLIPFSYLILANSK